ncbi:MAG: hypothetical protein KGS60_09800 [Verrucomicrobia bacterium]|nr:hypothetical protein [Verrucomicrobiota bacterium]
MILIRDWKAKLVSLLIAVAIWAVIESQLGSPRDDRRTKPGAVPGGGSAALVPMGQAAELAIHSAQRSGR